MNMDANFEQECSLPCDFDLTYDAAAVRFTEQNLKDDQKLQARKNIGAASADKVADIEKNLFEISTDHIIELGKGNGWEYRKWESGVAECWRTVTATVKTTDWKDSGMMSIPLLSGFGLFWTKDVKIQLAYPFTFASRPVETACMTNGTVWFPLSLISTTGKQLDRTDSYRICTYKTPEQDIDITISFYVIGKWKN